ncbi:hypothetical protein [Ureibacillus sinduriensis]|uniref:Prepilin-type N-terminal cleavage/methylation domain-containing protein n=1 Tax=Ureibacillus sinduriensis BLB-1 = JCM 15800 TaxID=1384057 RepID=A0A0A3HUP3_9BACL|nr:hypothetical protein [Ureibacillus sinduriensis]KGR74033.1 hypothetical protein CD33_18725 [Ureibacillus sinduriensis BLB-1 = JCM 15800]
MNRINKKLNEQGISLIEVIASILIISIVLISFFSLIIQSNRVGNSSEDIVNSTYIAQTEMENIYNMNKTLERNTFSNLNQENIINNIKEQISNDFKNLGYKSDSSTKVDETLKLDNGPNSYILLTIKDNVILENESKVAVVAIVIKVYENNILKTQMENAFNWKEEH